ncbi:MAG: hypothetical protein KC635_11950, partial [Myxococcales bacterium]|nr:hypothetical protein [Myxococcales bacterium]
QLRSDPATATGPSTGDPTDPGSVLDPEAPPTQEGPVFDELRALTRTALGAWKKSDLTVLKALAPPSVRGALAPIEAGSARAVAMFGDGSWRGSVAKVWSGTLGVVRIDGARALVEIARFGDGRVVVADAAFEHDESLKADHWYFVGLLRTPRAVFEQFGSLEAP